MKGLLENLDAFNNLREKEIDYNVIPSMVFNPVPPGKTFSKQQKPVKFSAVEVKTPKNIEDAAFYSVLQLARLIRTHRVTSTQLTKMYLSRLKRYNSTLKFVINFTEELALEQAKRADEEIQAGEYRGLLHGIPYGVKDLFSVKGYKTTWGAEPFKDRIIDMDATVVKKLEQAGAVLLAKLSTGRMGNGDHWFGGTTKNPWNPEYSSGGSSAGPASATAAGCAAFAIGTEANGSMLYPCTECGVTGLRPTFGRVSRYGVMPVSWSFDKVTPICRTVEDCAVVFNAIYGPDSKDNTIIDLPFNWNPNIDIKKLRIGYYTRYFEKELPGNPKEEWLIKYLTALREESKKVLDFFRKQGIKLIPLDFQIPHAGEGFILGTEAAAANDQLCRGNLDDLIKDSKLPDYFRRYRFVPAVEYIQATRYRSILVRKMNQALKDVDVYIEITWSNNWTTNVTGHPIVVVPCGFIDGWRPVSITFVGNLFGETETLAAAKAFQDATDFHLQHPKL